MCGRFTMITNVNSLTSRYKTPLAGGFEIESRYNIAPGSWVPVVTSTGIERMRWGLVPQWAKSINSGYSMFNAMGETLLEKRTYSDLIKHTRCLIPASGFYEWLVNAEEEKQPVYFKLDNQELFSLGGIYTIRTDTEGHELKSFSIITTTPNDTVFRVHDRMPLIIGPAEEAEWLSPDTAIESILLMIDPYPDDHMVEYKVSTQVNSTRHEGSQLILPIGDESSGT